MIGIIVVICWIRVVMIMSPNSYFLSLFSGYTKNSEQDKHKSAVTKYIRMEMSFFIFLFLFYCANAFQYSSNFRCNQFFSRLLLSKNENVEAMSPKSLMSQRLATNLRRTILPAFAVTSFFLDTKSKKSAAFAATITEDDFIQSLSALVLAKEVIAPTKAYVDLQAYDNARSNIKFILNNLQLQKQVTSVLQNSIDFSDDFEKIEAAQEAASRITNTAIQYDSTVYTCVFIPSDDGTVPPSAEKYRKQATNYYKSFLEDIQTILDVASESQLERAKAIAKEKLPTLPAVLFKDANALRASGI
jgi:hypothetical protein